MKHIVKIMTLLVTMSAFWISLLQTSVFPDSYTWLLPLYFIVSLGCYGLLMIGVGLMRFPTCPCEAILLQQDIVEAKEILKGKGVDVDSDRPKICDHGYWRYIWRDVIPDFSYQPSQYYSL